MPAASKKFCEMLDDGIKDEEEAIEFYEKLSKGDFGLVDRGIIVGLKMEEEIHLVQLTRIKMAHCGGVRAMMRGRHR